jgi:hypothetical protein
MTRKTTATIRIIADQNPALKIPPAILQLLIKASTKNINGKILRITNTVCSVITFIKTVPARRGNYSITGFIKVSGTPQILGLARSNNNLTASIPIIIIFDTQFQDEMKGRS